MSASVSELELDCVLDVRVDLSGYVDKRARLLAALEGAGYETVRPEGAFYICARLPVDDAQRFSEFLLRDHEVDGETVMIAPADGFYATPGLGRDEARIAYVLNEQDLTRAMRALVGGLERYPGRTG